MLLSGIAIGLLIAILIFVILTFFYKPITGTLITLQDRVMKMNTPKGFIVEPQDDKDYLREEIIKKNKSKGLDTPIDSLL